MPSLSPENPSAHFDNSFSEIELSPEEQTEAMRLARETKFYQRQREEYRQKMFAKLDPKLYNYGELLAIFKERFTVDRNNQDVVNDLCFYFSGDTRFSGDLKKGLLLFGGVGIGKSTLMEFFKKNQVRSYRVISCRDIETKFSQEGEEIVKTCSYMQPVATNTDPFGHQEIGFCFDDLGTEANAKHYGKEKNVMAEIILNRYDNNLSFQATHFTTNLSANELKSNYGDRVTDRLKQMVNMISFPESSTSRRK